MHRPHQRRLHHPRRQKAAPHRNLHRGANFRRAARSAIASAGKHYSNELGAREDSPSNLTAIILLDSLNTPSFDRRPHARKSKSCCSRSSRRTALRSTPWARVCACCTNFPATRKACSMPSTRTKTSSCLTSMPPSHATNEHNMQLVPLADENTATEIAQQEGNRAQLTGNAIRAIAEHVSYLPGRKSLIWISDDFPLLSCWIISNARPTARSYHTPPKTNSGSLARWTRRTSRSIPSTRAAWKLETIRPTPIPMRKTRNRRPTSSAHRTCRRSRIAPAAARSQTPTAS